MVGRIIETEADLAEGAAWLSEACPHLAQAYGETGPLRLRRRGGGFEALLSAIVSQQVSVASADAIWAKLEGAGLTHERALEHATPEELRAVGLSRQKARYAKALAEARIDYERLTLAPQDEVTKTLTAVTGIGVWTAEIYAMFSLGRADVFPSGDLALQEAAKLIYDFEERPSDKDLRAQAEAWSPWRSVAACLFWQYYAGAKQREG
ncbi:MAG: DNA-3-methyladenine glycosylase 2 family protein, partial [Pseudomonadota bacterium]